jgi:hypothetical protein
MSFTPEGLTQIYLNGALTEEAQAVFDRWMETDPAFSDKLVETLKQHLGTFPESLSFVETRLDTQIEAIWIKNKPSFLRVFLKKYFWYTMGLVIAVILSWALIHWGIRIRGTLQSALHLSGTHLPEVEGLPSEIVGIGKISMMPPVLMPLTEKTKKKLNNDFNKRYQVNANDVSYNYVNHSLQIIIDSEKAQKVAITVWDSWGHLVCDIYHGPWIAGHHVITWSGKNDIGNLMPPGKYTVVVQANGQTTSGVIHFPDF